jgi:hypothetical protein
MRITNSFVAFATSLHSIATLTCCIALCACVGNNLSFSSDQADVSAEENKTGVIWQAKAQLISAQASQLQYLISGTDAEAFSINSTTGELAFKTPADFEHPKDADQNNLYLLDITARAGANTAVQHLQIKVLDVSQPVLTLVKPRPNENVGTETPGAIEIETQVRFIDAESNTPIKNGSVFVNENALTQDATDTQLWKGKTLIPEGINNASISGISPSLRPTTISTAFINKPGTRNPSYLGISAGEYIVFYDPQHESLNKLNLRTKFYTPYLTDFRLSDFFPIHAWNSDNEIIYAVKNDTGKLKAMSIESTIPKLFSADCIPGTLSIIYDKTNKRVLALTQDRATNEGAYNAVAITLGDYSNENLTGTVFEHQQEDSEAPCTLAVTPSVFKIPFAAAPGTLKYFTYHETSSTFILADERLVNGEKRTFIQGFNASGVAQFITVLGGDISNLAVNQLTGLLYTAENHSSADGKLKEIDIKSGVARDIVISLENVHLGAYTNIQVDNSKNVLYIGDDVSDSIFGVDLAMRQVSDLNIRNARLPLPPSD